MYVSFGGIALFVVAPGAAAIGIAPSLPAMWVMLLAVAIALGGAIAGGVSGVRRQAGRGWFALGIGILPAIVVTIAVAPSAGAPRINDVTTDLRDPPRFHGETRPYPARFVGPMRTGYPDLHGLRLSGAESLAVLDTVIAVVRGQPRMRVTRVDRPALTLQGEARTLLFRFTDDFVIRVRRFPEGEGVVVDARSRSRQGKGDLGANARRIRTLFAEIQRLLGRTRQRI